MRIGIDIDDCLAVYMPTFLERVAQFYGVKIPISAFNKPSTKTEDYGFLSASQVQNLLGRDEKDGTLLNLPTQVGAVAAVNSIADSHQIIVVTSRNNYDQMLLKQHTQSWLDKHGFTIKTIEFTKNKGQVAETLGLEVLIDDSLEFARQAAHSGKRVILFAQPWNKNYKKFLGSKLSKLILIRTNNWSHIARAIEKYSRSLS